MSNLARRVWPVTALLIVAGGIVAGQVPSVPERGQAPSARDGVVVVDRVDDLAAITPEEKELALLFRGGAEVLGPQAAETFTTPDGATVGRMQPLSTRPQARPVDPTVTFRDIRRRYVCHGDGVVVVGRPISRRVILNADGRGMVSVYEVSVDRWITPEAATAPLVAGARGGQAFVGDFLYESGRGPDVWSGGASIFVLRQPRGALRRSYMLDSSSPVVDGGTSLLGLSGSVESVEAQLRAEALTCDDPTPAPVIQLQLPEGR